MRDAILAGLLSLLALAACDPSQGDPCMPGAEGCLPMNDPPDATPARPGRLVLHHGGLVIGAAAAVDERHSTDAVLAVGHIKSHAGALTLTGTLSD